MYDWHPLRCNSYDNKLLPKPRFCNFQHLFYWYSVSKIGISYDGDYFAYICLGSVISHLLVYYVIEYIGSGFEIVCSYFVKDEKEEIGFLYQKTLGITFLICVVTTPMIYCSDKFLYLFGLGKQTVR